MKLQGVALILAGVLIGATAFAVADRGLSKADGEPPVAPMDHGSMGTETESMAGQLQALSGEAFDRKFIELMIEHHQGAIDMAEAAKEKAAHAEIKEMADDIVRTQTAEIEQMASWRRQWGY